jgi:hypothetical protein
MYPDLAKIYLQMIKVPKDFGSILLMIREGGKVTNEPNSEITLATIRDDLHLIFSNAIQFNEGTPSMIAIATHLRTFTQMLWQELMNSPFTGDSSGDDFTSERYSARHLHYTFVFKEKLTLEEAKEISSAFSLVISSAKISGAVEQQVLELITAAVKTIDQEISEASEASTRYIKLSLFNILDGLISFILANFIDSTVSSDSGSENLPVFLANAIEKITANPTWPSHIKKILVSIDDAIGELLVSIVERNTRGNTFSSIWARPYSIVWALPHPKSVWWPGMLLVGQYAQGKFVPKPLADANYSRVPAEILKQLSKLKPKGSVTSSDAPSSSTKSGF